MRLRRLLVTAVALSALLLPAATASAAATAPIVLKRAPGLNPAERADLRADAGVTLEKRLPIDRVEVVSAPAGERAAAVAALRADPDVVWAEPDRPRTVATTDEFWPVLWGLENLGQEILRVPGRLDADIDAPEAWTLTKGRGVTVAVVDTGAMLNHPDLALTEGWDFVNDDNEPEDQHAQGHGTHVTGIVAAQENASGVVGVAPRARVMPIRVLDRFGNGTASAVASGFSFAAEHGVKVVNASIGAPAFSTVEFEAIRDHPDTLYVVAAGNLARNNDTRPMYPCNYDLPNIICVGASDQNDARATFSNWGDVSVDLHAPGVSIMSTENSGGYHFLSGTSMATPHVSGVAALLLARDPTLSTAAVRQAILGGADVFQALEPYSATGGRLNAAGALAALGPDAQAPAAPAALTATGADGEVTLDWNDSDAEDLAGYRVYTAGGTTVVAEPSDSTVVLTGPDALAATAYEVTALDRAGNESARSAPASAQSPPPPPPTDTGTTPQPPDGQVPAPPPAGGTPPAPPVEPAPPAEPQPERAAATILHARVTGRVVVCRRGCRRHAGRLRFDLGSRAGVKFTVARKQCRRERCSYAATGSRTVQLAAGPQVVRVGPRLAGVALRPGAWRVTLATAASRASASFRVLGR
jgi:thermitase